jgi:hypothetical protein
MDPIVGYTKENSVSCCGKCNIMKKCLDPITFKTRCQHISAFMKTGELLHPEEWKICNKTDVTMSSYEYRALKRGLDFELSADEFRTLTTSPCHYCGYSKSKTRGIDRKVNIIGYIANNCVPCCSECNIMKASLDYDEFLKQVQAIADFASTIQYSGSRYYLILPHTLE